MKKQATVEETAVKEVGTFTQVRQIFLGTALEAKHEPKDKVTSKEKMLGVIDDPASKAIYSLREEMSLKINQKREEHEALHLSGQVHDEAVCKDFFETIMRYSRATEVLDTLFWEMLKYSFPGQPSCGIRLGWRVVSLNPGVAADLLFDEKHPSSTFMADVRRVLTEDEGKLSFVDREFKPIDMEAEECKVGQIKSVRVKALYSIKDGLQKALTECMEGVMHRTVPAGKTLPQIIVEAKNKGLRMRKQAEIVDQLFWLALEEEIPATATGSDFAIRKDWTVVRVPKDEGEDLLDQVLGGLVGQIFMRRYGEGLGG
jgi:hypothetical protein